MMEMLQKASDPDQLREGTEALATQWEKAKKAGRDAQAATLESVLKALDGKPRSASERLTGKRPWAP
jgi:hypothetical protein